MAEETQPTSAADRAAQEEAAKIEVGKKLASQNFRLNNLYWVEDENGKKVKFRPRWEQRELHNHLHHQNAVLKCRQPGISTYCAILMLDYILFTKNKTCGIIDKTDEDAKRKLEKIRFAYQHLDDPDDPTTAGIGRLIKAAVSVKTDNKKEFELVNASKVWAGTGMRGGTLQFLWITELGYTSYYNPNQAEEIKKGALNTIHTGNRIIVESTHEGGKFGVWYNILKLAMEAAEPLSPMDWRFHFFAWHKHSAYTMEPNAGWVMDLDHAQYFKELGAEGITLTEGQKFWYCKKHASIGESMKSEFPSTPQEAFEAVIKGAIYGKLISALRAKKRIVDFEHDPSRPLYCFWDIGYSDFTALWLLQFCGRDICALAYRCNTAQLPAYYVAIAKEWERIYGIPITTHYLPHDADHKEFGGKSAKDHLREAGLTNTVTVPVIRDTWTGINHLRSLLPRFVIHKTNCGHVWTHDGQDMPSGIGCLEGYHTQEDASSGIIRETPVHDTCSHGCLIAGTMIATPRGERAIETIQAGDLVETPAGVARVKKAGITKMTRELNDVTFSSGSVIRCTPTHKFFTNEGLTRAEALRVLAEVWTLATSPKWSYLTELGIGYRDIITSRLPVFAKSIATFIGRCGRIGMGLFRRNTISTTSTAIGTITGSKTWNALRHPNISVSTPRRILGISQEETSGLCSIKRSLRRGSSTLSVLKLPKEKRRIARPESNRGKTNLRPKEFVSNAESLSSPRSITSNFAAVFANNDSTMDRFQRWTKNVLSAAHRLWTEASDTWRNSALPNANGLWVKSIVRIELPQKVPVYDLEIERHHCYFANGVLVSNSDALRVYAEAEMRHMLPRGDAAPVEVPRAILAGWNTPRPTNQPMPRVIRI